MFLLIKIFILRALRGSAVFTLQLNTGKQYWCVPRPLTQSKPASSGSVQVVYQSQNHKGWFRKRGVAIQHPLGYPEWMGCIDENILRLNNR